MRMKIKQTFRRKKSRLISSIKYKLIFNAETLLDLFYKWWCFDLETQNVHGFPELRAVFSTERSLHFMVLLPTAVYISCYWITKYENHRAICSLTTALARSTLALGLVYTSQTKRNILCTEFWESQPCSQPIRNHSFGISHDISSADWTGTI